METIAVKNLTFTYPKKAEPVLKQVEFSISDGQFVTICGKSGCGKSTLLKHFRTALTPTGVGQGDVPWI
ncbi:MAG: ATP-binding cassette domain-containing protein [Anaerovorax sp.]